MSEGKEKTTIHGKTVSYDPDDYYDAVRYLQELGSEEAQALFDGAKERRESGVSFETHNNKKYSLYYRNYAFEIDEFEDHSGWF